MIAQAIERKTPARTASEPVDELWLLITANASSASSTAPDTGISDVTPLEKALKHSGFARVYFHDVLTRLVLEWRPHAGWADVSA